ncbi:MAG: Ig-like domain-containing protein, partial [Firmicutes bacterium]|nr:Ig-like domain-containing protein [Bacillota bacterium]
NQAADSITLNKYSADIYVGKTVTLKAGKIQPRGCNDVVIWESSDESIATVTPTGVVKGIGQGTVTIRANSFGGVTNSVTITVRTRATAINAAAQSDTIAVGESTTVSVTSISPENCNDTLQWSTSSKSIATVEPSADGKSAIVKGLKKGSVTITVKTGSGTYKKIKIVVTQ